jgi:tetratricopeptide (TPR) repeat protein
MKKSFSLPLFLCVMLITPVISLFAQDVETLIAEGDKYYKEFNNEKALEVYKKADVKSPDNWEILWRISRAHVDLGEHMPASTSEQEDAQIAKYNLAFEYADRAVQLAPDQAVPYLRRAIANGRVALFKGVFSVADVVNSVRDDCHKAIELGNGGDDIQAITHYVLARTHAKISEKWAPARAVLGLGWAELDSSFVHYKKAIELKPNFVMFYFDYANALISDDEYEEAKLQLESAIKSPVEDEDDAVKIEEAKTLLKEVNKELN